MSMKLHIIATYFSVFLSFTFAGKPALFDVTTYGARPNVDISHVSKHILGKSCDIRMDKDLPILEGK